MVNIWIAYEAALSDFQGSDGYTEDGSKAEVFAAFTTREKADEWNDRQEIRHEIIAIPLDPDVPVESKSLDDEGEPRPT